MSFRTTLPKVRKSDFEGWRRLRNFASLRLRGDDSQNRRCGYLFGERALIDRQRTKTVQETKTT